MTLSMFHNIPQELKEYNQFVAWKYVVRGTSPKPTKVPYSAVTGKQASPTESSDYAPWASFDYVLTTLTNNPTWYDGMGFVLTRQDPFTMIDLDDPQGDQEKYQRQLKIYNEMQSYAELSPSNKGVHIILKGAVPSGRNRSGIEVYSSDRYMTMTGNLINGINLPVNETKQAVLDILWAELGGISKPENNYDFSQDIPETYDDETLLNFCANASNHKMFNALWAGDWQTYYRSQSEADLTLCNILAIFSYNKQQVTRLFHRSGLGQREKAHTQDYLFNERYGIIKKSFDRKQTPPIDFSALTTNLEQLKQESIEKPYIEVLSLPEAEQEEFEDDTDWGDKGTGFIVTCPPGKMGQLANYFYNSAQYPVPEYAITGALAYCSGIMGRNYNISKTGLNQYFVNVGNTGTGKEGPVKTMSILNGAVSELFSAASMFVGPTAFASDIALMRQINQSPSFCSTIAELSELLVAMLGQRPSPNAVALRRSLLDIFSKSGRGAVWNGMVYASSDKNIKPIISPALTIMGDTTPNGFYKHVTTENICNGLFPRFTIVENYNSLGNYNEASENSYPNTDMVTYLAQICDQAHKHNAKNFITDIRLTSDADKILKEFREFCRNSTLHSTGEEAKELWNRTHLRTLKTAGVLAALDDYMNPIVDKDKALWAIDFIKNTTDNLIHRVGNFTLGESYKQEDGQYAVFMLHCKKWVTSRWSSMASRRVGNRELHANKIIPHSYITKTLTPLKGFREDRFGSGGAIKRCIDAAIQNGDLIRVRDEIMFQYGFRGIGYELVNQ